MKKRIIFKVLAAFLISSTLILTGCSSKKDGSTSSKSSALSVEQNAGQKNENVAKNNSAEVKDGANNQSTGTGNSGTASTDNNNSAANDVKAAEQRKIIKSAELTMQTLKFDDTIDKITKAVEELGGYIESSAVDGKQIGSDNKALARNAKLQVKIPANKFDGFLNDAGNYGTVIYKSVKGEDITSSYFDTEARVNSLKVEEERLLELLKKSGSIKDIFEIEKQLADVRYQIESLTGNLKKWDNLVQFSSVTITVNEVDEVTKVNKTPIGFGEKLVYNFQKSLISLGSLLKGFVLFISSAVPYLVILGIISFAGFKGYKRFNKVRRNKDGDEE